MKVEINLDDPYKCQGCPLIRVMISDWCILGYWVTKDGLPEERPQACIDKHGL